MSIAPRRAARALLALLACIAPAAHAQVLTLDDALARAAEHHPEISAAGRAIVAAERHAELAALPPGFTVAADFENFGGTGSLSGTAGLESTLRLGRLVEFGGKRAARAAAGSAEVEVQRAALDRRRLDLAGEVRRRFVAVLEHQSRLEIAQRQAVLAERVRATVAGWVTAGRSPDSDRLQAEIAVLRANVALDGAQSALDAARVALASLWGEATPDFERAAGALLALPAVPPLEALAARLPDSVDQQAFGVEAEALDAQRRAAATARVPDLSVSMGVRRLEAAGDQALVVGVSVPLGTARRAALELDRLGAQRAALDDRREAARLEAYARLFALHRELQQAARALELHRTQMLPKAERALAITRTAYEAGRSSFLLLAQAQQLLADVSAAEIDAAVRCHRLLIDIERLAATGADAR